jgi:hypothetical protein
VDLNRDLIPQLDLLVERLSSWRGSLVEVVEQITRLPGTLDRHFTTSAQFVMQLRFVGIAFSGASLMLDGEAGGQPAMYQATCDLLEELSVGSTEVVFVEQFGGVAERRSTFRLLAETRGV